MLSARGFMASRKAHRRRQRGESGQNGQSVHIPPPTSGSTPVRLHRSLQPTAHSPWRHARNATCRREHGPRASLRAPRDTCRPSDPPRPNAVPPLHGLHACNSIRCPMPHPPSPFAVQHACRASIRHGAPSGVLIPVKTRRNPSQPIPAGMAAPAHETRRHTPFGPHKLVPCAA
jgi:hypothetical protein